MVEISDVTTDDAKRSSSSPSPSSSPSSSSSFKYVFIPCDDAQPIEEKTLDIPPGREMECLLDALKKHFLEHGMQSMEDKTLTKDQQNAKLREQLEKQSGQKIDDAMLKVAANMQMVQPVALLPGGTKNNFIHVNMYVDDKGISKGLRLNKRASDFTQLVNMPNHVAGDAFVARIFDDEKSDFKRIDFRLDELRSDAKWVEEARKLNTERRQNLGNAQETISKMGGNLNPESGMASFGGDGQGGLENMMMGENYQAPPTEADFEETVVEGTKTSYPYTWMQDEEEVVLIANVPGDVEKSSVSLKFGPGQNKIDLSCAKVEPNVIVSADETLFQDIVPGDSSWSLVKQKDGTKNLEVTLVKAKEKLRWLCFTLMRSGEEQKK
jgi:hypothetical protein